MPLTNRLSRTELLPEFLIVFNQQSIGKDDTYIRIDYILLSPAMARDWVKAGTYASTVPNWGIASDHRPIIAAFETGN